MAILAFCNWHHFYLDLIFLRKKSFSPPIYVLPGKISYLLQRGYHFKGFWSIMKCKISKNPILSINLKAYLMILHHAWQRNLDDNGLELFAKRFFVQNDNSYINIKSWFKWTWNFWNLTFFWTESKAAKKLSDHQILSSSSIVHHYSYHHQCGRSHHCHHHQPDHHHNIITEPSSLSSPA